MQFNTKMKLGLEYLDCIAEALIRINSFEETQKEFWHSLIDKEIENFLEMQLIPKMLSKEMTDDLLTKLKRYAKINQYFEKIHGIANIREILQPDVVPAQVDAEELMDVDEDYRQISIIPTKSDILSAPSFIHENIVCGKYENAQHYLVVQFKLLREDFLKNIPQ